MAKNGSRAEQTSNPQFAVQNQLMTDVITALGVALSEQERANEMEELALIDPLTGLPNERAFNGAYERFQANARRQRTAGEAPQASLLSIDVDKFKEVNDRFGHPFGDRMLQDVAAVMRGRIRPSDIAARLHGDEFAVLLPDTSPENAVIVAEDIRALTEVIGHVTLSIGVTGVNPEETAEQNLKRVDGALYDAKEQSRNQVVLRG